MRKGSSHRRFGPLRTPCRCASPNTAPRAPVRAPRPAPPRTARRVCPRSCRRPAGPGTAASTSLADDALAGRHRRAPFDGGHQRADVDATEHARGGVGGRAAQQVLQHGLLAALLAGLELELAAQHVDHGAEVDDPGHRVGLPQHGAAVPGRGGDGFGRGDREPRRHPGALIDRVGLTQVAGEAGDHLHQVVGHLRAQVRLLQDDADLGVELQRVVRADLGAEPVLERGDDAAAVGVVLGVGAGDHQHVKGETQRVSADLDVALLHHVEHRHLDALGEVGQFVDGDDAAVRARDQPVGDGFGVPEAAALGDLDRVDVADQVGHAGVRRGELLGVALAAVSPLDGEVVTVGGGAADRLRRDRRVRVLTQLGAGDHRRPLVEQPRQGPQQPRLALTALAEQDEVVSGDQRPLHLRQHGVLEAQDPRPDVVPRGQRGEQILPDFLLDSPFAVTGGAQFADGAGQIAR